MNSYIESFKEYLRLELNYSLKTVETYLNCLKNYDIFLKENNWNFKNIDNDKALSYKAYLIKKFENKTSSLNLSSVRSFYNYLEEIKLIDNNPFKNIRNPKLEKKLPNFLNNSEESKMFLERDYEDPIKFRNFVIIEFLYATGLRVSECVNVRLIDIDMASEKIRVFGKGSKERIAFFGAINKEIFKKYINEVRPLILGNLPSDYLFVSRRGNKLSSRMIENIVKDFAKERDIKSKVTPHTLRHTYATDLLNNGADIRSVGELLGHESLNTTQIYTHVTNERLKEVYNKTHPRAKRSQKSDK